MQHTEDIMDAAERWRMDALTPGMAETAEQHVRDALGVLLEAGELTPESAGAAYMAIQWYASYGDGDTTVLAEKLADL